MLVGKVAAAPDVCSNGLPVSPAKCLEDAGVEKCRELLDGDPKNIRIRLASCDGLVAIDRIEDAKGLLDSAKQIHAPGSANRNILDRALSNIDEGSRTPLSSAPSDDALRDYRLMRCVDYKNEQAKDRKY